MKKNNITIVSLGCSKNLVDSERLARRFADAGLAVRFAEDVSDDDSYYVINTCGFIGDAKQESIDVLLEAIQQKTNGNASGVYVMGCLSERYRNELKEEMPELDGIYGKFDWEGLVEHLAGKIAPTKTWERTLSAPPHSAYIKISEGCNRFCAFCAIPLITGRHHSRPVEEILQEVTDLASKGTKDFNIIAQDLSSYGRDLEGGQSRLATLLEEMCKIEGVEMIRLHYAYPSDFPYDILPVMAANPKVCRYLDIALQHIDDQVLNNMRRHITADQTRELLARIRREVPGVHIRTTLMVGFPGETEEAFQNLKDFVAEQRFERMGAFAYCEEEGTFGAKHFKDEIPEDVKHARLDELMELQEEIAFEHASSKVGSVMRVIIDSDNGTQFEGRTEFDSPEVDPIVYVDREDGIEVGKIYNVEIYDSIAFDLVGRIIR